MRKLSIFVFCLFVSTAAVNAQETTTTTTTTKTTTTSKKPKTIVVAKKTKTGKATTSTTTAPPPPPPAGQPAPIPVPMDPSKPPMPIDPHAAPPPPPTPMGQKPGPGMRGRNGGPMDPAHPIPHDPAHPGGANAHMPPTPPGQPAPPRPYDPSVDNVPVGPNAGVFQFKEETHDFGTFEEGPIVETDFEFKNAGKEPITIKDAHGSCGCTIPTWPKEPIAPGKTAKIHVTFNSKGRVGVIHKDVTIVSNAKQQPMMLHIAGEVKSPAPKN